MKIIDKNYFSNLVKVSAAKSKKNLTRFSRLPSEVHTGFARSFGSLFLLLVLLLLTTSSTIYSQQMIQVAGGTFQMGSTTSGTGSQPVHSVTLDLFYIDKTEMTYEKWTDVRNWGLTHGYTDLVAGRNGYNGTTNHPVTEVIWYDIVKWCNARSEKDGLAPVYYTSNTLATVYRTGQLDLGSDAVNWTANGYRLPTEAEWEFAAGGGTASHGYTYSGSNNLYDVAWFLANSDNNTHPVSTKMANELGLNDMSGNVWEWVWDWYGTYSASSQIDPKGPISGTGRVLRGGAFSSVVATFHEVPNRSAYLAPDYRNSGIGFRCVQTDSSRTIGSIPASTKNLTATGGNGQVTLKWSKNTEADFLKYRIYMGSDSTTLSLKDSTTATISDTTKTITGLTNSTKYFFRVTALDSMRSESGQSYAASATPSINPASPNFGSHRLVTYHGGDDRGSEDYGYDYWIDVTDPQGLSDIVSVAITTPDGLTYQLYDDATRGDGVAGDGRYSGNVRGLAKASSLDQCRIVVIDKSNNTTTVLDTLFAWMPYARNVRPAYNDVVQTSLPTFNWDSVAGISSYTLRVIEDATYLWGINVKNRTSVTYNENGTGPNLQDGKRYWWDLYTYDAKGNYGYHYRTYFTYSSNATSPVLTNPTARSAHYGDDKGNFEYKLILGIQVADPQGLSDIDSVRVTGPSGKTYSITDDNNDGWYETWFGGLTQPPELGAYRFRVTDKTGNWTEAVDSVEVVMDYPKNVRPASNEVISSSSPTFSWNAVSGITRYYVWVNDVTGKQIWWRDSLKTTSVVYNDDGTAKASLKDGGMYTWAVDAFDAHNNWGEQDTKFSYSTSTTSPNIGGHKVVTYHGGDERGGEDYGYDFWIDITDPQGLSDIASVAITIPDGLTYQLYDDGAHGDGQSGDGRYNVGVRGLPTRPSLGQCRFVVTDKSNNITTVYDTLSAWTPYARNVRPANNEVVNTNTPIFIWDTIAGASSYTLLVYFNGSQIWSINTKNRTSIKYNEDGTGQNLVDGKLYTWYLYSYDVKGNYGYHYGTTFAFSTNSTSPIISNMQVRSRHWVQGDFSESWGIDCWVNVSDPQGLNNIDSVWVDGPSNYHSKLYDDGNHNDNSAQDGKYAQWIGGLSNPPIIGEYKFKVIDKSGNLMTASDTLTAVINYPKNVVPQHNTAVSIPAFIMSWDKVQGADWYEARILTNDWSKQLWSSGRKSNLTSIQYNADGAGEQLTDGGIYIVVIWAGDKQYDGDEAERRGIKITYRTNNRRTVYVDSSNTSGNENGTINFPFNTIQEGINAAIPRDTVLVSPGRYVENINFGGRNIVLSSLLLTTGDTSCISRTIIDGNKKGVVVGFYNGEDSTTILNGFSIVNGYDPNYGGMRIAGGASPQLTNLVIRNNVSGNIGGGIIFDPGNSHNQKIKNVRIFDNSANRGGGLYFCCGKYNAYIMNVVIHNNKANIAGGSICSGQEANLFLTNVTIANNSSNESGIVTWDQSKITLQNCILWNNQPQEILGNVQATYSNIKGGFSGTGNINKDPLFGNVNTRDYHLQANSLCIDAGNPDSDGDGITWTNDPADQDPDGTRMDMGALYFDQRGLYPSAPQKLSAIPGNHKVGIIWSANNEFNISYYKIYRSLIHDFTPASKDSIAKIIKPDTLFIDNDVTNGQIYYYRISAVNIVGNESPFGAEVNAIPGQLPSPVLVSPLDGAINQPVSITLSWNTTTWANTYRLQVSTNINFTTLVFDDSTITATSQKVALAHKTTYYWRVRMKNIVDVSGYSVSRSFATIIAPPPTPVLASPADLVTNQLTALTLSWNSASTAISYHLQVATDTGFTATLVNDSSLLTTSKQVSSLAFNTEHYWRVRGMNIGGAGYWSTRWRFTTRQNLPKLAVSLSNVNFGIREAQSVYRDTIILLTNDGGANLIVSNVILAGADTIHYSIQSGGGAFTLQPAQTKQTVVRFCPLGVGVKSVNLTIASNDPGGTYTMTLRGQGVDTTPPQTPNAVINPSGWTNQPVITVAWTQPTTDVSGIPKARYKYDSPPVSSDSGLVLSISGLSTTIAAPALGKHLLYFWLIDGSGNASQPATQQVKFDNVSPVIQHDSVLVASFETSSPQSINITASTSDEAAGMKSLVLQFKRSGTGWSAATSLPFSTYSNTSVQIPASFIFSNAMNGVDYRITAIDSANNVAITPTHSIAIHLSSTVTRSDTNGIPVTQVSVASLPANTPKEYAYRMYSVPFILDNKTPQNVLEIVTGLGSYDDKKWRFFRLNTNDQFEEYPTFSTQTVIDIGKAFFMIVKEDITIKVGSGTVPKTEDINKNGITLKSNYNAVGNPFNFDVLIDSLSLDNGQSIKSKSMWEYVGVGGTNGGWKPNPTVLRAWEGILLKMGNNEFTNLKFRVADRPLPKVMPLPRIAFTEDVGRQINGWKIDIHAQRLDNGMTDVENVIGTMEEASDSVDVLDLFEPPMVGDKSLSVSFASSEGALTHDFRSPKSEGWIWDLQVKTPDKDAKVELMFNGIDSLPGEQYVIDKDSKMVYNLQKTNQIAVNSLNGTRKFRLIIGSKSFAEANSMGVDLFPKEYVLYQNYPNPFNPSTTIRFSLPVNSSVKLMIYDILGREIVRLIDREMIEGYQEVEWKANVSTGIYFYRLQAAATDGSGKKFVEVRKMVLMK